MDPQSQFCHNPTCPARAGLGQGTIRLHSRTERRYRCTRCGHTFAATKGTPFYRLHQGAELLVIVLTLLIRNPDTIGLVRSRELACTSACYR